MEFSIGHIKSDQQLTIKRFADNKLVASQIISLDEVKNSELNCLLFSNSINDIIIANLKDEHKFYPIVQTELFQITPENFENINFKDAQSLLKKIQNNWLLQNNITLLEELFVVLDHLAKLWPNQRTDFFEHLWFILKSNLGTTSLQIVFNDIELSTGDRGKNKLTQNKIVGKKFPESMPGTEMDEKLMLHYKKNFIANFNICEFNEQKGEMVITALINKSPVLILAQLLSISKLQKTILATLFDGINRMANIDIKTK